MGTQVNCSVLLLAFCLTGSPTLGPIAHAAATAVRQPPGPLVAEIPSQPVSIRAGLKVAIPVYLRNISQAPVVIALEDVLRAFSITAEAGDEIMSELTAEDSVVDRVEGGIYCPGALPTFLLSPGQGLVQVISVPVSKTVRGTGKLEMVLRYLQLEQELHCGTPKQLEIVVSATVKVLPVKRK